MLNSKWQLQVIIVLRTFEISPINLLVRNR